MSGRLAIAAADAADVYSRLLKHAVVPCMALLAGRFAWVHLTASGSPGASDVAWSSSDDNTTGLSLMSYAADTGLAMPLKSPFPPWVLLVHGVAGFVLVALTLYQKQTVGRMATARGYATHKAVHKWVGIICLVLALVMATAGFALGDNSAFSGFGTFSYYFAAPWFIIAPGVWLSAKRKNFPFHRLMGNLLVKACIAVPLSRVSGAVLQVLRVGDEEFGFYTGIFGTAAIISVWAAHDVLTWLSAPSQPEARTLPDDATTKRE